MKKSKRKTTTTHLDEYDFSKGVRGKYSKRYAQGNNLVLLEPDVLKVFPTPQAVNAILRTLAKIIRSQAKQQ